MSQIKLNHIEGEIDRKIKKLIDISDLTKATDDQKESALLSRSFALYSLKSLNESVKYEDLSSSITDGFGDNGIDAIHFNRKINQIFIVQSKWIKKGTGGPDKGEILKFLEGIRDLITFNFEAFNQKVKDKYEDVKEALHNRDIKIKIVLAYTGNKVSDNCKEAIQNFIEAEDGGDGIIQFEEFDVNKAHRCLTLGIDGDPINAEIDLLNWGKTDEPVKAYYGTINCAKIVDVFSKNKGRLFSQNIRGFMGDGEINDQITKSVIKNPETFFYLNNGITILAKKVSRSPAGGGDRSIGHFHCDDITIVNGAQTVGSMYQAHEKSSKQAEKAFVFVRIMSLENCPDNFDKLVTIATNTQNKIERKDFVSLDENQHRLKTDLILDDINYSYKRDDSKIKSDSNNFHLEEVTVSLACQNSNVDLSTLAKREIGRLWEDTKNPPYTLIFNSQLKGNELVRITKISRQIETIIKENIWGVSEHEALIITHGNHFLKHIIFQNISSKHLKGSDLKLDKKLKSEIERITEHYRKLLCDQYMNLFDFKFPPTIFKNLTNVRKLKDEIYKKEGKLQPGQSYYLFEDT